MDGILICSDRVTVVYSVCVGAYYEITVNGGRDENALSSFIGALENYRIDSLALALVKNVLLTAYVVLNESRAAYHLVNVFRECTCGVNYVL